MYGKTELSPSSITLHAMLPGHKSPGQQQLSQKAGQSTQTRVHRPGSKRC